MIERLSQGTVKVVTPTEVAVGPWVGFQTVRSPGAVPIALLTKVTNDLEGEPLRGRYFGIPLPVDSPNIVAHNDGLRHSPQPPVAPRRNRSSA